MLLQLAAVQIQAGGLKLGGSAASAPGRPAAFLVLASFLVTWLFIRTSARLIRMQVKWWPGNVQMSSGLHLHHLVWGIVLMMLAGFVSIVAEPDAPWWQLTAIAFGVGVGLTLDEFALWIHLKDVYWTEEGRSSIDAVVFAFLIAGLVAVGASPFDASSGSGGVVAAIVYAVIAAAFALVTFAKGRLFLGAIAIFIPLVGIWCTFRLAKPTSLWARRRYREATERGRTKLSRARKRFPPDRWSERFGRRFQDLIGGTPTAELGGGTASHHDIDRTAG